MGEDASRIRKRSGPEVMAAFRNAAIGFLRSMGVTNIAEALRRNGSQVARLFARLGILKQ
jgi:hypothetical protein